MKEKELGEGQKLFIRDSENLERKIAVMKEEGTEHLHVLSDFDRTLTYGKSDGKKHHQ